MKKVIINPVTRISGFMEIDTFIENNIVVDARTEGLLFRGFELMLKGRPPMDAVYFTERICGICSTAHSIASSLALEQAFGVVPSEQGRYLRDIMHGCEFLQNHIRHFYQYTVPDFIRLPGFSPLFEANGRDFRLPKEKNDLVAQHYFDSLAISRNAHKMLAVLGGKAPHNHGVFIGGAAAQATVDKIMAMKSMLHDIGKFIDACMVEDAYLIAQYYSDYYQIGGGYGNLLSFGCFNGYKQLGTLYVDPLVHIDGRMSPFYPDGITESTQYSYYVDTPKAYGPYDMVTPEEPQKSKAYSWVKAPRYFGSPCEVGPLARLWLSGEYRHGISTMDRTVARVLEAKKIAGIIETLLNELTPGVSTQTMYEVPQNARGAGLIDTTRGALGHWLEIDSQVISLYQLITPSAWNLSTQTENVKGTGEKALMGTCVEDEENPVELGRIIRSFDPCVSCATHVYTPGKDAKTFKVVP